MLDLIIEGGLLVDGSGAPRRRADVGLRAGLVAELGDLRLRSARERFDARGQIVAPGFIDVHTHDDHLLLQGVEGVHHPKLSQGVTTVVTGNCGISLAPLVSAQLPPAPLDLLGREGWRHERFADYLGALESAGPATNAACLVGHTTLRVRHMAQLDRPATAGEARAMAQDLEEALRSGALGLSTGFYYPPARAATVDEVLIAGAPLRAAGGLLAMHIRDEGAAIDEALREALSLGQALGVDTVLSHHKLVGRDNHGRSVQTLGMIEAAARHQGVCLDCYPYTASSTMLLAARVSQSDEVLITWSQADPTAAGQSLFTLARQRGCTPEALAEALSPAGAIYFAMSEEDVSRILAHPLTLIGSDGLPHDASPHPRLWGSFPRVLGHYARDRRLFSLETAVHKMTGLSARRFGLQGRGLLVPGHAADLVVFDALTVGDRATFAEPARVSHGIRAVFVNGRLACLGGRTQDRHAGQVLRRGPVADRHLRAEAARAS
ncbi:MAG: D-aminoacylase [Curvibacter sp.]|nr:D-aminoacylase [Curvibacter sp.]